MTDKEKIKEILESSKDGMITSEQVSSAGLHRNILQSPSEPTTQQSAAGRPAFP